MEWGMDDDITATPRQTRQPSWGEKILSLLSTLTFIAFVVWIVDGAAGGGQFLWWVVALLLAPIVLYLAFIAAVGRSFIRQGKRNVREAQMRKALGPPGAPDPDVKRSPPRRREPRED
jgi:hypothetical protein